jgi:Holliday junction resolvasome RuvABC endonuclease subunit
MELGGILRYELSRHGFGTILEPTPGQVKKYFSGSGRASKQDMEHAWTNLYQLPDIYTIFKSKRKTNETVHHPMEDIIDGLACALYPIISGRPRKNKGKKRKKNDLVLTNHSKAKR